LYGLCGVDHFNHGKQRDACNQLFFYLSLIAAAGWWPDVQELAEKDDAAEVVGVVGGEAFQLFADGHGFWPWLGWVGWAVDRRFEACGVVGEGCGGFCSGEEAALEGTPGFVGAGRETVCGAFGPGCGMALNPVEREVLPEGHVPDFFIDRVRDGRGWFGVRGGVWDGFEDVFGWSGGAVADDGAG